MVDIKITKGDLVMEFDIAGMVARMTELSNVATVEVKDEAATPKPAAKTRKPAAKAAVAKPATIVKPAEPVAEPETAPEPEPETEPEPEPETEPVPEPTAQADGVPSTIDELKTYFLEANNLDLDKVAGLLEKYGVKKLGALEGDQIAAFYMDIQATALK